MKKAPALFLFLFLFLSFIAISQTNPYTGMLSVGSRNTFSLFNDDANAGVGIGAQFRIQFGKRVNSEWFLDYITSKTDHTYRNDYHIGWSLLFYGKNNYNFEKLFQPYIIAGHCFDYSKVMERGNKQNHADRLSMATQAGLGTHINITSRFDCSVSAQYMLHLGKEIETAIVNNDVIIEKKDHSGVHGHFLMTISANYKLFYLWKNKQ